MSECLLTAETTEAALLIVVTPTAAAAEDFLRLCRGPLQSSKMVPHLNVNVFLPLASGLFHFPLFKLIPIQPATMLLSQAVGLLRGLALVNK